MASVAKQGQAAKEGTVEMVCPFCLTEAIVPARLLTPFGYPCPNPMCVPE